MCPCSQCPCPFGLPVCQNCIEVDAPTISGIVIADVVATLFLAVAVYCITGHDRGHTSRGEGRESAEGCAWAPLGAVCGTQGLCVVPWGCSQLLGLFANVPHIAHGSPDP